MQVTSLVILDLKEIDPEKHRQLTGRSNENILAMARHVAELGVPLWIRHVLVPGLTDDEEGLCRTGAFIASLPTVQRVEVLPYHTLGLFKWQKLGIPYSLADAVFFLFGSRACGGAAAQSAAERDNKSPESVQSRLRACFFQPHMVFYRWVLSINGKRCVFPWLIPGRKALLWALRSAERGAGLW